MTLDSMRTYFARPGHQPVDSVTFAQGVLTNVKRAVADQINRLGFTAARSYDALDITLGDPANPVDPPLMAYVNNGEWKLKCECGGCEFVDLEARIAMCCSCWNLAHSRQWRNVTVPTERAVIEAALLLRPDRVNRNWKPGETVAGLLAENAENGIV